MSIKILIIDQDRPLVKSLERTFDFCGYEVWDAPDGMIGVQMAIRHKPDLIILELEFPSGGAYFVLQNLKRSLITRDIPVLVLTGSSNAAAKKRLMDFGLMTYLQKPCDREELLAQVVELLGVPLPKRTASPRSPLIATGDYKSSNTATPSPQTPAKKI
jgi:DNA-binding response OmpR family regulator